jgi:uncharacterized protein (TIGR02266 family)
MTVRYKSATVDEFIEHHSHDVSRGGIFIKTPSPFPPGTLLKFEIRIQDEQSVLAGVGRVVWKRDGGEVGGDSPAGMGVKFIKIDDKSKGLIQRLVESQPEGTPSAFEAGKNGDGAGAGGEELSSDDATKRIEAPAPAAAGAAKSPQKRASTMLGLGSIGGAAKGDDKKESTAGTPAAKDAGFFPQTNPDKEMPPAEERTVMKQAAELLKQALAEAGGSLDEIKDLGAPVKDEPKPEVEVEAAKEPEAKKDDVKVEAAKEPEAKKDDVKVEAAVVKAATKKDEPAAKPKAASKQDESPKAKPAEKTKVAAEERAVAAKPAPKPLMQEPEQQSGGTWAILKVLLVVAGIGGAVWMILGKGDGGSSSGAAPDAKPAPIATMTAAPVPTMTAAPVPTMTAAPTATASAAPSASTSASAAAAASASAAPSVSAKATATPAPPPPPAAVTATPKPPVATPPVDKPKPPPAPRPKPAGDDPYG